MLRLAPMSDEHFAAYLEAAIPEYAADKVKAGEWLDEEAVAKSREGYGKLLPQGLASPGQFLFDVVAHESGESVGLLWIAVDERKRDAFIYDVMLDAAHRGRGLGRETLGLAQAEAARRGCRTLSLHVFAHNTRAWSLYVKSGFEVVDAVMRKTLP
jgi:ribosomal protein S18 acetylase RimI-like enzyme